jgi:hypothetical protein
VRVLVYFHRIASSRGCVGSACVCKARVCCAHTRGPAGTCVVCLARPATRGRPRLRVCVGAHRPVSRVGRRCELGEPHGAGAVGCARMSHVRDRRHLRCHLRPRRPRPRRRRHLRLHPRCVGEHRRRCAGRTASRGLVGVVPQGVCRAILRGTQGYYRSTRGGVLEG